MGLKTLRFWCSSVARQTWDRARAISMGVGRRLRPGTSQVDVGVGVGGDESRFGGQRTQFWYDLYSDIRERIFEIFETTVFERFPGLRQVFRRFLGAPPKPPSAPSLPAPRPSGERISAPHVHATKASRDLLQQVERDRMQARLEDRRRMGSSPQASRDTDEEP
jgi:hypothetical protein